jgi:hypothetical protein
MVRYLDEETAGEADDGRVSLCVVVVLFVVAYTTLRSIFCIPPQCLLVSNFIHANVVVSESYITKH